MAELPTRERLQPSLLDRLTDVEPEHRQESRERRVMTTRVLRQCVQRDLSWLLNSNGLDSVHDLAEYPYVAQSVVNFGFPDIAGKTASGIDMQRLERQIRDVVLAFEPRILRDTIRVTSLLAEETTGRHNTVSFMIEGDLWAQPFPERLYLKTELDLEAGKISIVDQGGPR